MSCRLPRLLLPREKEKQLSRCFVSHLSSSLCRPLSCPALSDLPLVSERSQYRSCVVLFVGRMSLTACANVESKPRDDALLTPSADDANARAATSF